MRRRYFIVALMSAVACGAAQVVKRGVQTAARGGARCASRVLDRGALADARGAARCFCGYLIDVLRSLPRPRCCRSRRRTNLLMRSGKEQILPECSDEQSRCAPSWPLPTVAMNNPAVASRRAKYADDIRLPSPLGAQPIFFLSRRPTTFGAARCFSQVLDRGAQGRCRGAAALSQQEKNNSADMQRKRANFTRL